MAAYTRKQYSGAARNTTTTTLLTNVGTTVDIAATTGWPSIAGIPFYVVIQPSTIYEEKCLATISGSTLTLTRAQDDTTASQHPIGSVIYPVFTANDADEANELVSKLTTAGDLLTTDGTNLLRLGVGPNGYFLKASSSASAGIEWALIPTINYLDDVGDVLVTTAVNGDYLKFNGSNWVSASLDTSSVFISASAPGSPQEGDLWFDSSSLDTFIYYPNAWLQQNAPASEIEVLDDLFDVLLTSTVPNQILGYNGTEWVNIEIEDVLNVNLSEKTANYVLVLSDKSKTIEMNVSSPNTVTIPLHSSVAFPIGTEITVLQYGTGKTQIVAAGGVTIRYTPGTYLRDRFSWAKIVKRANNEWYLYGDLSSS